jgi:hypothetical protein
MQGAVATAPCIIIYSKENFAVSFFFGAVMNIRASEILIFVPSDSGRFSPFTSNLTL